MPIEPHDGSALGCDEPKPDAKVKVSQPVVIACVEDDASVGEALEGLLIASRLRPTIYVSAEEFLSSARLDQISCLILDVELGGMSGIDLQRRLGEQGRRIPTIIITAFGTERMHRQALEAGAVAFLSKPVSGADLLAELALALRRRSEDDPNL